MRRWSRYWFDDGGRVALAIVRIAVATSVLLTLGKITDAIAARNVLESPQLYRPVGIWMLLGSYVPSAALVHVLWMIACASTVAMLVGVCSRISTVISFVTGVALASLVFATSATWSHQFNVVFLAQLALFGARSGDALSADWLIRRVRGLPAHDVPGAYQWSLRLVQLAVALMFVSAVFYKLLHSHFTLRWALSDNLRHQLLVRFDLARLDRPPLVDWLIAEPVRYQGAALLNMIAQASPLLAVVFVRRPLVRAFAGLCFVSEIIGLGLVVKYWDLQWLPLAAVFVDWDRVLGIRPERSAAVAPRPSRAVRWFIIAFVVFDVATAFIPTLDQRLNTYPFSGFPMFAKLRVRAPYDEHQPYTMPGAHFDVTAAHGPIDPGTQAWFDQANRKMVTVRDPDALHRQLAALLAHSRQRYCDYDVRTIRMWLTLFEAPAYPAPARFEQHPIAVIGEVGDDGSFHTQLGTLHGTPGSPGARVVLPARPGGWAGVTLLYYQDDLPTPHELGPVVDGAVDLSHIPANPLYVVAVIDGTPWLIASFSVYEW